MVQDAIGVNEAQGAVRESAACPLLQKKTHSVSRKKRKNRRFRCPQRSGRPTRAHIHLAHHHSRGRNGPGIHWASRLPYSPLSPCAPVISGSYPSAAMRKRAATRPTRPYSLGPTPQLPAGAHERPYTPTSAPRISTACAQWPRLKVRKTPHIPRFRF